MSKTMIFFICSVLIAIIMPLLPINRNEKSKTALSCELKFPQRWQGKVLTEIPLTKKEKAFDKYFPGKTSKKSDGNNTYIFRWILYPTRKLHPPQDCYRGLGFQIKYLPIVKDNKGRQWGVFSAKQKGKHLKIMTTIVDTQNRSWSDIYQWYWQTYSTDTCSPWLAITIIKNIK